MRTASVLNGLLIAAVLGVIASATPTPTMDDGPTYREIGREVILPGCPDLHCFRILVPAVLEHLPGPSLLKWKAYAVAANAIGAVAVGWFCLLLGLSVPASLAASWISALGAGALYSLFDCYTADPLMYMLGPLIAVAAWQDRVGRAAVIGGIGILAKEFAAAPLCIFAALSALERRWRSARRLAIAAVAATLIWMALHAVLRGFFHYRYGATASMKLAHGAYIAVWIASVGLVGGLRYLFLTYGALYLLLAAGLMLYPRSRRLALAALPAVAAFVYVQQPERALWNFHFIVVPIAVQVLEALPAWGIAAFAGFFAFSNLRFGAQLPIRGLAQVALLVSLAVALVAIIAAFRKPHRV